MESFGNIYVHMYYDISREVVGFKGLDTFWRPGELILRFIDQDLTELKKKIRNDLASLEDLYRLHPYFQLLNQTTLTQILDQSKHSIKSIQLEDGQQSGLKNLHIDRLIELQQIFYSILSLMNENNPNHSKPDYYKAVLKHEYIKTYRFYSQPRLSMVTINDKTYPLEDCLLLGFEDCLFFEIQKLITRAGYIKICKRLYHSRG